MKKNILLFEFLLFTFVVNKTNADEVTAAPKSADGSLFTSIQPTNIGYDVKSIIQQLEDVSRMECILVCQRTKGCGHVIINDVARRCKLLREVMAANGLTGYYESLDDGEKVFSLSGTLY